MHLLIANRPFRLLFSASAVSNLGDGIAALAFPWLATLITRDPMLIALVAFATRLPWLLLAIPAGVLTDRGDRRRLMVQADVFRVLVSAAAVALALGVPLEPQAAGAGLAIAALAGLAFLLGCAEVVRDNAAQTLLPSVVGPGDLERANGQMWSIEQVMGAFVGPPLAGALIALAVPVPFVAEVLAFGLAAWCVWLIALPPRLAPVRRTMWIEAAEAWRWMRGHPMVLRLAVMLGLMNALGTLALTVLVLVSQERLGLSAAGHGLLLTAGAAGGVAGGLLGPRLVARHGGQACVRAALVIFPLAFALMALAGSAWVMALALFVEMVAAMLWNLVTVSWRQRLIPDAMLGRVNALYRFFAWGMMPLGALAGGWVLALAGPVLGSEAALRLPYLLAALGSVMLGGYGWWRLRFTA